MGKRKLWISLVALSGCYTSVSIDEVVERDGDEATIVRVADFGATPNDGACDLAQVRAALAAAVNASPATLTFESGTYDFDCFGAGKNAALEMYSAAGVRLQGDETSILIDDLDRTFLEVYYSTDIDIEGLDVRWTTAPYTQGFVESVSDDGMVVAPLAGFPAWTDERFSLAEHEKIDVSIMHVNDRRRIKAKARQNYRVESLAASGNRVNLTVAAMDDVVAAGDPAILRVRRTSHVIDLFKSKRVTITDVSVTQSPGVIISGSHNEELTIDGLSTYVQPGHWTAGNADGMNLGGTKGPVVIRNCTLEGLADDFINLHGRRMRIAGKVDARTIDLHADQVMLDAGDEITIVRPSTGAHAGAAEVVSSTTLSNGKIRLVVDRNLPAAFGAGDLLYNESRMSNGFVIEDNTFRNGLRHGIVVRGKGGTIRSNDFRSLGSKGIGTQSDLNSIEGYRLANTLIEGNAFRDVAISNMSAHASIYVTSKRTNGNVFAWRANEGNRIVSNTFKTYQGAAVVIEAGKHNEIDDNVLLPPTASFYFPENSVFVLYNVNQTSVINNDASADPRNHDAFLRLIGSTVHESGNVWQ